MAVTGVLKPATKVARVLRLESELSKATRKFNKFDDRRTWLENELAKYTDEEKAKTEARVNLAQKALDYALLAPVEDEGAYQTLYAEKVVERDAVVSDEDDTDEDAA